MANGKKDGIPPFVDPDGVQEVAADEVLSVETGGGMTTLVFGKRRMIEQGPDRPPRMERRVKARLVLSDSAVNTMIQQLMALSQARRQMTTPPPGESSPTAH
jgi:hypothetical protein